MHWFKPLTLLTRNPASALLAAAPHLLYLCVPLIPFRPPSPSGSPPSSRRRIPPTPSASSSSSSDSSSRCVARHGALYCTAGAWRVCTPLKAGSMPRIQVRVVHSGVGIAPGTAAVPCNAVLGSLTTRTSALLSALLCSPGHSPCHTPSPPLSAFLFPAAGDHIRGSVRQGLGSQLFPHVTDACY